jgi:hypothetical protein
MDEETKKIQPEIENLNLDEIDVEELEKRLELAVATAAKWGDDNCEIRTTCQPNNPPRTASLDAALAEEIAKIDAE